MNKAFFLDRDGVLNHDYGYISKHKDIVLIEGVKEALQIIVDNEFIPIIITNQSGISRGYFTHYDLFKINCKLNNLLGNKLKNVFYCPHTPEDNCQCRKPNPYMIIKASEHYNIDLSKSWMIGDKDSDILCGKNAGVKTIKIGNEINNADYVFPNLLKAVEKILCNV